MRYLDFFIIWSLQNYFMQYLRNISWACNRRITQFTILSWHVTITDNVLILYDVLTFSSVDIISHKLHKLWAIFTPLDQMTLSSYQVGDTGQGPNWPGEYISSYIWKCAGVKEDFFCDIANGLYMAFENINRREFYYVLSKNLVRNS